ncbi:protein kinase [Aureococcus anophagefferens]|nr:protein kinase [Aureococcus anophagefferens]
MRAVEHPNVARLVDVVHARARLYLVLEHGGRDLYGYVGATFPNMVVPEPVARHVVSQLVAGCCALSARGVVHHDVKSENVLVAPGVEDGQVAAVRLTDLGMSETYEPGQRGKAFCGSPGFFPPEMVAAADYDPFKVDAWSIGCVALELLLGRQWFSDHWLPASKLTDDPAEFAVALSSALADLAAPASPLPRRRRAFWRARSRRTGRPARGRELAATWVSRHPHLRRLAGSTGDLAAAAAVQAEEAKVQVEAVAPAPTCRRRRSPRRP